MKTTQEIKTLVKQIVQLAMEVSEETEHDVFVDYGPHVNGLYWSVYYNGWTPESIADNRGDIILNLEDADTKLLGIGVYLTSLKDTPCTQA